MKNRFYYLKQHDIVQEVLPMQSFPQCLMQLLLIHWKNAHMDFMYSWEMVKDERKLNNCDISNTPALCDR